MGPTEEPADHYGYPYRKTVRHGLHGRIAFTPARLVGYGARWEGDRAWLWAEGEIRQAAMFGEFLVLHRKIEAEVGGRSLRIDDTVTNHGFRATPHAMLYHVNVGWPVVDAGTRLVAPIRRTRTRFTTRTRRRSAPSSRRPRRRASPSRSTSTRSRPMRTARASRPWSTPAASSA